MDRLLETGVSMPVHLDPEPVKRMEADVDREFSSWEDAIVKQVQQEQSKKE